MLGTFHFLSAHPYFMATSDTGPVEILFLAANTILNPPDVNFKGSDDKKLGCRNLSHHPQMRKVFIMSCSCQSSLEVNK